jgi:hypothetical protein
MHGIILITHASAFLEAATHVYNQKPEAVLAFDVSSQSTEKDLNMALKTWLFKQVDQEISKVLKTPKLLDLSLEYLIMNDVVGATPFNFAKRVLQNDYLFSQEISEYCQHKYLQLPPDFKVNLKFALCSYLNFPALLKAICYIQSPLEGVLKKIETAELKCQAFNIIH